MQARSPELGITYGDLLVLEQLVKAGGDPDAPRHVLYYLYFDSSSAAEAAAAEADEAGFETTVSAPDGNSHQWGVVCERHRYVLDLEVVRENSDFFDSLVDRHRGEYDGWEASVG